MGLPSASPWRLRQALLTSDWCFAWKRRLAKPVGPNRRPRPVSDPATRTATRAGRLPIRSSACGDAQIAIGAEMVTVGAEKECWPPVLTDRRSDNVAPSSRSIPGKRAHRYCDGAVQPSVGTNETANAQPVHASRSAPRSVSAAAGRLPSASYAFRRPADHRGRGPANRLQATGESREPRDDRSPRRVPNCPRMNTLSAAGDVGYIRGAPISEVRGLSPAQGRCRPRT